MGVFLIKWAWLKSLRALRARLYLQPHHSKNPRSAPEVLPSFSMLHARDITRRETVERPTSKLDASKVTEIWRPLVANDREVPRVQTLAVECSTILLVHKRVAIEEL